MKNNNANYIGAIIFAILAITCIVIAFIGLGG